MSRRALGNPFALIRSRSYQNGVAWGISGDFALPEPPMSIPRVWTRVLAIAEPESPGSGGASDLLS